MDGLDDYRAKRDFDVTPEPGGEGSADPPAEARFVVQEHSARAMHWDLRLEHAGTLASWAVPKGIPPDPATNHLAVRTEDHPLEYLDFHGDIPEGNYGAGSMRIWDRGTYELHKWRDKEVMVTLHGERVQGRYVLFRTGAADSRNWMIHRMDPPQDPGREPLPEHVDGGPMLAKTGPLPKRAGWAFEVKWDGIRALAYVDGGRVRLQTRTGNDVTARYPELRGLGRALGSRDAILDGEIIAFGDDGKPSFQKLQSRMHLTSEPMIRRLSQSDPVVLVLFDLLFLEGHPLLALPYTERRERLLGLGLADPSWPVPAHHVDDGERLLAASRAQGLEGVVAKRLDSTYQPGRRTGAWVKVKNVRRVDVVVGGWLEGERGRAGRIGALLVGYHEDGELRYAGRVGTGFTEAELARLGELLTPLSRDATPFSGRQPPRHAHFVEPVLVAAVDYGEWTSQRTLRHPAYKGLRDDVDPATVVFEASP